MDYEKKYKEALERAREALNDGTISSNTIAYLQDIFPELKESEDEKIRKALIDFFSKGAGNGAQTNGVYDKDILAWLENQGEQKPWSEDDELVVKDVEEAVTNYWYGQSQEDLLDWLNSLKQRIGG